MRQPRSEEAQKRALLYLRELARLLDDPKITVRDDLFGLYHDDLGTVLYFHEMLERYTWRPLDKLYIKIPANYYSQDKHRFIERKSGFDLDNIAAVLRSQIDEAVKMKRHRQQVRLALDKSTAAIKQLKIPPAMNISPDHDGYEPAVKVEFVVHVEKAQHVIDAIAEYLEDN